EYYQLQAIFLPAYNPERWKQPKDRIVEVGSKKERDDWKRQSDLVNEQIKKLNADLATREQSVREPVLRERLKDLDAALQDKIIQAANAPAKKRSSEQNDLLKTHAKAAEVSADELAKHFPEFAAFREQIKTSIGEREKERPKPLEKL